MVGVGGVLEVSVLGLGPGREAMPLLTTRG